MLPFVLPLYLCPSLWRITTNGLGLCEEAELEAQMFVLAQMFIRIPMFNLALNPLFCKTPVTCCAFSLCQFCFLNFRLCVQSCITPRAKSKIAKIIIKVLKRPTNVANAVKIVAPPSQTANEVIQQQLVPNMKANAPPKNDFL